MKLRVPFEIVAEVHDFSLWQPNAELACAFVSGESPTARKDKGRKNNRACCSAFVGMITFYVGLLIILGCSTDIRAATEPPPCSDPDIMKSLHDAAVDALTPMTKPLGNVYLDKISAILIPEGKFDMQITEMFTVARSEDKRDCQATLHLVEPNRTDGTTSIRYSVVRTEDGKNLFAIQGEGGLAGALLRSIEANNNLIEKTDEIRREILRSASIRPRVQDFDFNQPSPSNFGRARTPLRIPRRGD